MLRKLSFTLLFSVSMLAINVSAQSLAYMGEGVRQNTTLYTFDSYKIVHSASSFERSLSPNIARSLHFTMLTDWGSLFTKDRMVEALEQSMQANATPGELSRMSSEIQRFKKTMMSLPINNGTELLFNHNPGSGMQILMKGPRGFVSVFQSADQTFSMTIMAIWLGQAHPNANNRGSLEQLIRNLWANAQ